MPDTRTEETVEGSAYVELRLTGRWALSLLTEGWTGEECAALRAGDPDARTALEDALTSRVLANPDECDTERLELTIGGATPYA